MSKISFEGVCKDITDKVLGRVESLLDKNLEEKWIVTLRSEIMHEITTALFNAGLFVTKTGRTWLTDQHFKAIKVNDSLITDLVIMNEFTLDDLDAHDIAILRRIYLGSGSKIERLLNEHQHPNKQELSN